MVKLAMRRLRASRWPRSVLLALCLLPCGAVRAQETTAVTPAAPAALVNVVLQTSLGEIHLALEKDRAPITVANFLHYVDTKRFDGTTLYRALKLDADGKFGLVQGGLRGNRKRAFKPIAHESPEATGLSHVNGAVSMARGEPGSATADFFIIVGDLLSLDGKPGTDDPGYAVFGHVTAGMELVQKIMDLPRDPLAGEGVMKGQMLAEPVKIITARRGD